MDEIKEFCTSTKDFFVAAGKGIYYVSHPKEAGLVIWNGCVHNSFNICLLICLISIIIYTCGYKKAKIGISGSFIFYLLINMINSVS